LISNLTPLRLLLKIDPLAAGLTLVEAKSKLQEIVVLSIKYGIDGVVIDNQTSEI